MLEERISDDSGRMIKAGRVIYEGGETLKAAPDEGDLERLPLEELVKMQEKKLQQTLLRAWKSPLLSR